MEKLGHTTGTTSETTCKRIARVAHQLMESQPPRIAEALQLLRQHAIEQDHNCTEPEVSQELGRATWAAGDHQQALVHFLVSHGQSLRRI